jgi:hypothetical protein
MKWPLEMETLLYRFIENASFKITEIKNIYISHTISQIPRARVSLFIWWLFAWTYIHLEAEITILVWSVKNVFRLCSGICGFHDIVVQRFQCGIKLFSCANIYLEWIGKIFSVAEEHFEKWEGTNFWKYPKNGRGRGKFSF